MTELAAFREWFLDFRYWGQTPISNGDRIGICPRIPGVLKTSGATISLKTSSALKMLNLQTVPAENLVGV